MQIRAQRVPRSFTVAATDGRGDLPRLTAAETRTPSRIESGSASAEASVARYQ